LVASSLATSSALSSMSRRCRCCSDSVMNWRTCAGAAGDAVNVRDRHNLDRGGALASRCEWASH
jgi:hypothetical protein